ncbi:dirigent protein 21-like [Diospyros lotus]|uniref:dirigent protein 21-like n=1 Tax=Diospyros lotus TaxID=55363 RepID=UPI0022546BEE|nr:dirigent protein 21-like [Diospyros lotus]
MMSMKGTSTMAKAAAIFSIVFLSLLVAGKSQLFSRTMSRQELGLKKEKLSHLHFYFHDTLSGRNPTAIRVAEAPTTNSSATLFGAVVVIDDPLTLKPEPSSKQVGRAQGIYASAAKEEIALFMAYSFVFTEGKYNGSTLSVSGRNPVPSAVREMAIVGGSGLFRFARGYAQARTHWLNFTTGDAIVEYDLYVSHY